MGQLLKINTEIEDLSNFAFEENPPLLITTLVTSFENNYLQQGGILFSMIYSDLYLSITKIIRMHSTNKYLIRFWHMFKFGVEIITSVIENYHFV